MGCIPADTECRQNDMEQRLGEPKANQELLWTGTGKQEARYLRFLRTRNKADDYETIKLIGKGAFGEVKLVRKKTDSKIYALKSLVKTQMVAGDQVARVRAERDIMAESDSPWVVKLFTTFQDTKFLYMLMEFLPGGDLMTMLIKYDIFSEDITRFYVAEIIMAIEAVHKLEFIHRSVFILTLLEIQKLMPPAEISNQITSCWIGAAMSNSRILASRRDFENCTTTTTITSYSTAAATYRRGTHRIRTAIPSTSIRSA